MALSSDVIFFGIQAVLKLKSTAKEAQIAQIKKQSLKLVLPGGLPNVDAESAKSYFVFDAKGQEQLRNASERVKYLVQEMRFGRLEKEEEKEELVNEYYKIRNYDEGRVKVKHAEELEAQQVFALLHLKQWEDDTTVSPLQSVVGSVINLGVSLLQMKPELINSNTSEGRLLKSFLSGFDSVDFANTPTNEIVSGLMSTTIELLDKGAILGADNSTQQFLKKVTEGVATDISSYIQKAKAAGNSNLQKEDAARNWGTTIFRSVIQHAGATALGNPMTFLGANAKNNSLIQTVGNALLDVILNDVVTEDGKEIKLSSFISQHALDTITRASVVVLSEHPEWYEFDNEGIKNVVTGVVRELAAYPDTSILDILPRLVNALLTLTAGNLELIYQGDPSKPQNNILLTATRATLSSLKAAAPTQAGEKWKPVFSKGQTMDLIDTVFQAVITKPDWLLNKVGNRPILEEALTSVLTSLQGKALRSLNSATRLSIIRSALSCVALSQNLLKKVNIGNQQKNLLSASLDIVIDLAFKDNASANVKWALVSSNAATMLIDATLHRISAEGASVEVLGLVKQFLEGEFSGLEKDRNFSLMNLIKKLKSPDSIQTLLINSFDTATRVVSQLMLENPNVSNIQNEGVKNIVNGLFDTLKNYPKQLGEDLLPDLVKSILGKTAENLEMIFPGDQTKPTNNLLY